MPAQLAFITVGDQGKASASQRATIRSHVMRGKNKIATSRRSVREAARKASASLVASSVLPSEFEPGVEIVLEPEPNTVVVKCNEQTDDLEDDLQSREDAVAAYMQIRRFVCPRTGVTSPTTGRDMSPGELVAGCRSFERGVLPIPGSVDHGKPVLVYDRFKSAAFPIEQAVDLEIVEANYVPWLFTDAAFAHSILLVTSASRDFCLQQSLSRTTIFHLRETLRLLNKQLSDADAYLADTTTYTIVTLAVLASMFGDFNATRAHMAGLQRITQLRGGEKSLSKRPKQHFMLERSVELRWRAA